MVAVLVWRCCVARTRVARAVRCLSARALRCLPLGPFGAFRSGCAWWWPIPHGSPTMSHVIPLRVFQTLKSRRWDCNVCGVSRKMTKLNYVRHLSGAGLEARPGPADTHWRRSWVLLPRVLVGTPVGPVVAACRAWFPNNVARNSPASISDFEIASLGLQRLWGVSKNDQVKLRATLGEGAQSQLIRASSSEPVQQRDVAERPDADAPQELAAAEQVYRDGDARGHQRRPPAPARRLRSLG